MNYEYVKESIDSAVKRLYEEDYQLFSYDSKFPIICERTLAFRLGHYLQEKFYGYNVDCEYNRHADDPKCIDGKRIYPDIIIHNRGSDSDNLVWIEVKKGNNLKNAYLDKRRLKYVTGNSMYRYEYGFFIALFEDKSKTYIEYYKSGEHRDKYYPFA